MAKSITEMAVEIVVAQSASMEMSSVEIEDFLRKTFKVLQEMRSAEDASTGLAPGEAEAPAMDPAQSIQKNKVICLECGKEFKLLTNRHLQKHGLTAKEYRKKYGFPSRQPLSAQALSSKRRKTAKALGLGERLKTARKGAK